MFWCTGGATFYVSSRSKSGLFGINLRRTGKLELDAKTAMAQQSEKNSASVNRIIKKKTSCCLIDVFSEKCGTKNTRARS